ncbi:pentapeptide repeat-containing protein [Actinobaculum suis]|uniref:pentapeptide repeat-containing protein n=1 Tax=Actinobaculum suis TaxID=1657 RepID=UPI003B8A747C
MRHAVLRHAVLRHAVLRHAVLRHAVLRHAVCAVSGALAWLRRVQQLEESLGRPSRGR